MTLTHMARGSRRRNMLLLNTKNPEQSHREEAGTNTCGCQEWFGAIVRVEEGKHFRERNPMHSCAPKVVAEHWRFWCYWWKWWCKRCGTVAIYSKNWQEWEREKAWKKIPAEMTRAMKSAKEADGPVVEVIETLWSHVCTGSQLASSGNMAKKFLRGYSGYEAVPVIVTGVENVYSANKFHFAFVWLERIVNWSDPILTFFSAAISSRGHCTSLFWGKTV